MKAADPGQARGAFGSRLARAMVLVLAVLYIYAPAFRGGWLWDDDAEITANPSLHSATGLWDIWFSPKTADYFPLKSTLQWVQWHLWGDSVLGYHLVNVALHALAALLLWKVLARLGVRCAWLGGLLFAVHPLAVESVAWISEFKNVLSLTFLLLAMLAYLNYDEILQGDRGGREERHWSVIRILDRTFAHWLVSRSPRSPCKNNNGTTVASRPSCKKWYFISFLLFGLAMLSKTTVVMFPVILLLYAWWRRGRVGREDLVAAAPFFAVAAWLGWVTVEFQKHRAIAGDVIPIGGTASRVAGAGLAAAFYAWKAVWPAKLMPIYTSWKIDPPAVWQFWPWVVMGVIGMCFWKLERAVPRTLSGSIAVGGKSVRGTVRSTYFRAILLGVGFFLINLVPVMGFVPMSILRLTRVADHLAYLPLVGLVGLAAAAADLVTPLFASLRRGEPAVPQPRDGWLGGLGGKIASISLATAAVAALAVTSRFQAEHFAGPEQLWTYELRLNQAAWAAHNNLGNAFFDMGRVPAAEQEYEQALRIRPDYPEALNNLANILSETGRLREAATYYLKAFQVKPDYGQAHNGYGNLFFITGNVESAIAQFNLAVRYDPNYAPAHNNLGNALYQLGRYREAEAQIKEALRLQLHYPEALNNLGNVYSRTGRLAAATVEYSEALRIRPHFSEVLNNLGNVELMQGRLSEATASLDRALALRPNYPEAHYNLGLIFLKTGRNTEAEAQFKLALQFRPNFRQARTQLEKLDKAKPASHG